MIQVVKVGGGVIENPQSMAELLDSFVMLPDPSVLIHGGGRLATQLATQLGIETHMVGGRRITDSETLRVVTMVYGGLVNKQAIAQLETRGITSLGLTGADMHLIRAHRRPIQDGIDYGYVGDIDAVDAKRLIHLLHDGITPVISPLTLDENGILLNTNADTIASAVAIALAMQGEEVQLTFCLDLPGVMRDAAKTDTVIADITPQSYEQLKADGIVNQGMIPKLDNAFSALKQGVKQVRITSYNALDKGTLLHA